MCVTEYDCPHPSEKDRIFGLPRGDYSQLQREVDRDDDIDEAVGRARRTYTAGSNNGHLIERNRCQSQLELTSLSPRLARGWTDSDICIMMQLPQAPSQETRQCLVKQGPRRVLLLRPLTTVSPRVRVSSSGYCGGFARSTTDSASRHYYCRKSDNTVVTMPHGLWF